tara:strand:- start:257 stop:841 length:585 start_codon:yes stop_codon:yes gene_type:complete
MGRVQSSRIAADTNIISRLDSTHNFRDNPCVFNGIIISALDAGANIGGVVTVYSDNNDETITPTINFAATGNTITINGGSVSSFTGLGLSVGDLITITNAANSGNNRQHKITAITSTVITTDSVTDDATSDAITIQKNNIIWRGDVRYIVAAGPLGDLQSPMSEHLYTNGIFCKTGLRVEAESWTNLECFILHS